MGHCLKLYKGTIMEKERLDGDQIFLIHDFLTEDECQSYIALSEELQYDDAPISTAGGFVMRKDIRNNARVIYDNEECAKLLFEKAAIHLPSEWFVWKLFEFNERFRFYRYDVGQRFAPHTDGYFQRDNGDRSQFTFMIYLNDDFEGGGTTFLKIRNQSTGKSPLRVQPRTGMALVFYHHVVHEGEPVTQGRKYVLRTDVMYQRQTPEN